MLSSGFDFTQFNNIIRAVSNVVDLFVKLSKLG